MVREMFPDTVSDERFVLLTLAAADEEGRNLTMKELAFSEQATATTLRRRLARLVQLGYVEPAIRKGDHRTSVFTVTKQARARFRKLDRDLTQVLREFESRSKGR